MITFIGMCALALFVAFVVYVIRGIEEPDFDPREDYE